MAHARTPHEDFDEGPPFVFGFGFKAGTARETTWKEMADSHEPFDFIWLHLNMNSQEAQRWIRARADIPHAAQSALLAGETRPRVSNFDNGLVVNLRGVNLNEGADPEDMVSLRIWLDGRRVITTRRRRLKAAQDLRAEIAGGVKAESSGALVAKLASRLTTRMEPYVLEIADEVDALEDAMLKGDGQGVRAKLADTRQSAVRLRRYIAPQRDALSRLAAEDSSLFDGQSKIELREITDMVTRMTEEIDAARERAMVLQDQLADQRAEEMNRNMMILSVVAAIFLPLGFLTGLLGINVGGMPGADNPVAFWIVAGLCAGLGGALAMFFMRKGWL